MTTKPLLFVPIGVSGSGKSTAFTYLKEKFPDLQKFSWDDLRLEFYDTDDYALAFELSCSDRDFKNKANIRFKQLMNKGADVYVDNTNLTAKRRKFYLEAAKKRGYMTIAISFEHVNLETLIERQLTRGDKCVPENAVINQYQSLQPAKFGEFDVEVSAMNLVNLNSVLIRK